MFFLGGGLFFLEIYVIVIVIPIYLLCCNCFVGRGRGGEGGVISAQRDNVFVGR